MDFSDSNEIARNQVSDFEPWRVSRTQLDSERVQELVGVLKAGRKLPKGGCPEDQTTLFRDETTT